MTAISFDTAPRAAGQGPQSLETDRTRSIVRGIGLVLQLSALVVLMRLLRIESPAFYERLMSIVLGGAIVHHLLPAGWRLGFFALLSLAGIVTIFGAAAGAWLIVAGVGLIVICHLPLPFVWRVVLLLMAGITLALQRATILPAPWPSAIWPILGSMFMFRLIAYMYDLQHQKEPVSLARTISYFFLLPNVCFPLFPVVDFATFRRTYYDRPAMEIYQQGMVWIARGVLHLVLYRAVYQYATISVTDVATLGDLIRYLLANFGLYLRVSGQFHLIVGLLHLFGFRLPETHRFFYLASSFTDFWRRINIYWKDFMQKVAYNPVYFRLKRQGDTFALVASTIIVFTGTWFFHSYQWFWILGSWLLSWTDTLFWLILAVVLIWNAVREAKRGRPRVLPGTQLPLRDRIGVGLRTAATFAFICVLWGMWTRPTVRGFITLMRVDVRPSDFIWLVLVLAVVATAGAIFANRSTVVQRVSVGHATWPMAALAGIYLFSRPELGVIPPQARDVAIELTSSNLNRRDATELQRGYYERLVGVNRFNGELWRVYSQRGEVQSLADINAQVTVGDLRRYRLRPGVDTIFVGARFRVNQWGMRDRMYERTPAPGVVRIAVLGSSYVMGHGVSDHETFENVVEDLLNEGAPKPRFELLNFAVSEYTPLQHLAMLDAGDVFDFSPHILAVVGHRTDLFVTDHLARAVQRGVTIPYDFLSKRVAAAGLTPDMPREEMIRRLQPHRKAILSWLYHQIAERAAKRGMRVLWIYIPTPRNPVTDDEEALKRQLASDAGFTIVDLSNLYHGVNEQALMVSEFDEHPNADGHRFIARRLHQVLREQPHLLLPTQVEQRASP